MSLTTARTRIYLDLNDIGENIVLYMSQYDNKARVIEATIYNSGIPYTVPGDGTVTAKIFCDKPDGKNVFNNCTIENGKVVAVFTDQMLAAPGMMPSRLSLFGKNGERLGTADFIVSIRENRAENGVISTDEFNTLTEALKKVVLANQAITDAQNAAAAANEAKGNTERATAAAVKATTDALETIQRAEKALSDQETLEITLNQVKTMAGTISGQRDEVKTIGNQVAADKLEIDQTIKDSIISSSEEIISSMQAYLSQANALYSSMYFNADGENPAARAVTLVTIDCGNPASRAVNPGIIFDGGTPLTRILGQ